MIKNNKGFTTIELLIVVSIISVLSGVVYFIYNSVSDKRQVNAELKNIEVLVGQLKDSTISSTYHNVSNETLLDYGITYNSNFYSFNINGTSDKSFEIDYKDLNSRQCSDFALKTSGFKGEYILTRKVNGKIINNSPTTIASECAKDLNTVNLEFEGLVLPQIAQITPGTPKPPPVYAGPGTFVPDLPDRGDVPTNLADSTKVVGLPEMPIKGAYVPPIGLTENPSIVPGGDIFDTGGYVKPVYEDKPPPPVISGEDNTNFRPETPTPPPPPAPPAPKYLEKSIVRYCDNRRDSNGSFRYYPMTDTYGSIEMFTYTWQPFAHIYLGSGWSSDIELRASNHQQLPFAIISYKYTMKLTDWNKLNNAWRSIFSGSCY